MHMIDKFKPNVIMCNEDDELKSVEHIDKLFFNIIINNIVCFETRTIKKIFDNSIAYVLFTSGSTGLPKGCMIKRESLEKFCIWAAEEFSLSEHDVCGQYVPLYFDMSLLDIFGGFMKGVTLVPFPNFTEKLRPGIILKKYKITFMNVVPQFLEILMRTNQFSNEYLSSLRMIRFGGDKIYENRLEMLFEQMPELKVVSTYGPTETTCFCFYKIVDKNTYKEHSRDIITIGNTIPGWNAYLRNIEENIGEIVVYGEYIGAGYLDINGGEQFSKEYINGSMEQVYYTGDYATIINSEYYFKGRRDAQVKINGNRVSLSEVEFAMLELGCREAVAVFCMDNIFCFYCAEKNHFDDEVKIKEILQTRLPRYAIPSSIARLDVLPYNANGKIDKKKLIEFAVQSINYK
jgi:D-alanine--poly(phosphoribitol) ligase subunit 1